MLSRQTLIVGAADAALADSLRKLMQIRAGDRAEIRRLFAVLVEVEGVSGDQDLDVGWVEADLDGAASDLAQPELGRLVGDRFAAPAALATFRALGGFEAFEELGSNPRVVEGIAHLS
jgi:hypothetical protein